MLGEKGNLNRFPVLKPLKQFQKPIFNGYLALRSAYNSGQFNKLFFNIIFLLPRFKTLSH
jgi:hypothetical protein